MKRPPKKMAARSVPARVAKAKTALLAARERKGIPPAKLAPAPIFPVEAFGGGDALAPPPIVDRFPWVIGGHLDAQYVASIFRLATTGYRQQYVDLLRELLEMDGHLFSVLSKRISAVANGRFEFTSAIDNPEDPEFQDAKDIRGLVAKQWAQIPNLTQAIVNLLWGIYYGATALEQFWDVAGKVWTLKRFEFIHSRRISWPDGQSWSAHIWDQGQVLGWQSSYEQPTNRGVFGLPISDWPGKFVLFTPQLTGDYPTRDGLGRECAIWAIFKRIGGRGASDYLERFAKGFMDIECRTALVDNDGVDSGHPREATKQDIALAKQIANTIGYGSGSYAVHPDSIKINPQSFDGGSSTKITFDGWMGYCNSEHSKIVLGGTVGTEITKGAGGNRAVGEQQERGEVDLEQFDATALAEAFRWQSVWWIVKLNRPEKIHLCPGVQLHIDVEPDAKSVVAVAKELTAMGGPVDLEKLSAQIGVPLVENKTKNPRRSYVADKVNPTVVDSDLMSEEAKQQVADANDAQQAIAIATAQQPANDQTDQDEDEEEEEGAAPGKKATGSKVKPKAKPKAKPKPAKPASKTKKASDVGLTLLLSGRHSLNATDIVSALVALDARAERDDGAIVRAVYEELLDDYPPAALEWVLAAHWEGPEDVPLNEVDFSERKTWRASHEDIAPYVKRLKKAIVGNARRKPAVFVKTPGNTLKQIVDGHHRTLAAEACNVPAYAYTARVYVENGPWMRLHGEQLGGSSKEPSVPNPSKVYEEDGDVDHDNEAAE
jgi:phage gp29-like protein